MSQKLELERKFVLKHLPNVPLGEPQAYRQAYIDNPIDGLAMRVRQEGEGRVLQFKLPTGKPGQNVESEKFDLGKTPEVFERLMAWAEKSSGKPVEKSRYDLTGNISAGDQIVECILDQFHGANEGHIMMEVEFHDAAAMAAWRPTEWMKAAGCREVTGNPAYGNESISVNGWPKEDDA